MSTVCLDDGEIAAYVGRRLAPPERERVDAHLDVCGECRALVSELARDRLQLAATAAAGSEVTRHTTVIRWPSPRHAAVDDEPTLEIDAGQLIAGKYQFQRMIGGGAMGVVVAATHLQLGQLVALKFMNPAMLGHEQGSVRFRREARAAASLRNEHVGRVLDLGTLESGEPYIVMEYLEGEDLRTRLEREGAIGEREALELILQACAAVGEAHRYGIVHRDLKPANLFLSRRGDGSVCLKVLDFGISKVADDGDELTITETDRVLGSPLYTAPEQLVSARDVDGRADIWSLGVILYQMIAGAMPYQARTLQELVARVMVEPPRSLAAAGASASPAVEAAIRRCLERDVTRRFQTIGELQRALAAPDRPPVRRPSREAIAIAAAGIAAAGAIGLWLAARQVGQDDPAPAARPPAASRSQRPAARPPAASRSERPAARPAVPIDAAPAAAAVAAPPPAPAPAPAPAAVDAGTAPDSAAPAPRRVRPVRSRERPATRPPPRPETAPEPPIGDDDILPPNL